MFWREKKVLYLLWGEYLQNSVEDLSNSYKLDASIFTLFLPFIHPFPLHSTLILRIKLPYLHKGAFTTLKKTTTLSLCQNYGRVCSTYAIETDFHLFHDSLFACWWCNNTAIYACGFHQRGSITYGLTHLYSLSIQLLCKYVGRGQGRRDGGFVSIHYERTL